MGVYTIRGVAYGEYTIQCCIPKRTKRAAQNNGVFYQGGRGLEIYEDDKLEIFVDTKENINTLKQNEAMAQEEEADGLQEILN